MCVCVCVPVCPCYLVLSAGSSVCMPFGCWVLHARCAAAGHVLAKAVVARSRVARGTRGMRMQWVHEDREESSTLEQRESAIRSNESATTAATRRAKQ